ncbi:MAG TPA: glucose 1-dehydrogenase [Solirubrobacterales bacterium]|nr:glucose 1-dehydrogenase [Solirubrobacterales bacterium]
MSAERTFAATALKGKVALITGAGKGLGRGIAEAMADAGAAVVLMARTGSEVEALAASIESRGGEARAMAGDVTDLEATAAQIAGLERLDILVNNAGTNVPQPLLEVDPETFDRLMAVNVRAAYFTAQAAARLMVPQGSGCIINMSSQMGHIGGAGRTVYCAAKHAIEGMTKAMAVELGPQGVRVNALAPTFVETPMTRPYLSSPQAQEEAVGKIPLGRLGAIDDITGAAVFLASPAASLVNGTSFLIDGGYTAQ